MKNLIGTEKQIIWAEKIRKEALSTIKENIEELEEDLEDSKTKKSELENIEKELELSIKILEKVENEINSEWFINNRDYLTSINVDNYKFIR